MGAVALAERKCVPCEGGVDPLTSDQIENLLGDLNGWAFVDDHIEKTYTFANYYETISFVNAVAWVSNQEGHHPNLEVNFRDAKVKYWTHAIGGMSENDFICAAKVDAL
jgi:4a-hydroxytetrahydrobiopterin dehydratase